jgi:hypothetical protein
MRHISHPRTDVILSRTEAPRLLTPNLLWLMFDADRTDGGRIFDQHH